MVDGEPTDGDDALRREEQKRRDAAVWHAPRKSPRFPDFSHPALRGGDVVVLSGDLGAGKTTFVQGAADALGVRAHVTSPSFVLVREYSGRARIVHVDVYRLSSLQELIDKTMGAKTSRADLHISHSRDGELFLTSRQDGMIRMLVPDGWTLREEPVG